jgi:hypothetical protein
LLFGDAGSGGERKRRRSTDGGARRSRSFASWVWLLEKDMLRVLLSSMQRGAGEDADGQHIIYASSVELRDDVVRAGLHAGYSPRFSLRCLAGEEPSDCGAVIAKHDCWAVAYPVDGAAITAAEPCLHRQSEIKEIAYNGRTWCVSVPHGLIVVRRAVAGDDGVVVKASAPVIVGNCMISHGASGFLKVRECAFSDAVGLG